MQELKDIKSAVKPTDTLLVVDAMTGQEAANLVKTFNDEVDITGEASVGGLAAHTLLAVAPPSCTLLMLKGMPYRILACHISVYTVYTICIQYVELRLRHCFALPHSGAILTKMDGDSRGGAALSVREVGRRSGLGVWAGRVGTASDVSLSHSHHRSAASRSSSWVWARRWTVWSSSSPSGWLVVFSGWGTC